VYRFTGQHVRPKRVPLRPPWLEPDAGSGEFFLTEGGSETEIMYRHGFELPEFPMFPLLDDPKAVTAMRAMFCAQLIVGCRPARARSIGAESCPLGGAKFLFGSFSGLLLTAFTVSKWLDFDRQISLTQTSSFRPGVKVPSDAVSGPISFDTVTCSLR
jgi:hypothetical protein